MKADVWHSELKVEYCVCVCVLIILMLNYIHMVVTLASYFYKEKVLLTQNWVYSKLMEEFDKLKAASDRSGMTPFIKTDKMQMISEKIEHLLSVRHAVCE